MSYSQYHALLPCEENNLPSVTLRTRTKELKYVFIDKKSHAMAGIFDEDKASDKDTNLMLPGVNSESCRPPRRIIAQDCNPPEVSI